MVQNVNPTFIKTPNFGAIQITTGTGSSTVVTIYVGAVNGSKIPSLIATAIGTTSPYDVQWGVSSGGAFYICGTGTVPAGAGSSDSIPTTNLLSNVFVPGLTLDSDGNQFLLLPSSAWSLQAKTPATSSTWAAGAVINLIVPSVGDF